MMKNLLIDLPEELFINNILLSKVLLPIKSLLSLRCVCKYLRNIINSPAFIKMHLHHSTTSPPDQLSNQLVLIESSTTDSPYYVLSSLKFNDGDDPCRPEVVTFDYPIKFLQIWGSCNGLLCITEEFDRNMVCLWNPSTKEYKHLPSPLPLTDIIPIGTKQVTIASGVGLITYGFGYDRFIDDYKIIRCEHIVPKFKDGTTRGRGHHPIPFTEFQVYTLGTNTWRKISSDNNPFKSYYVKLVLYRNKPIVFVNGALHWIMSKSLNYWRNDMVIVSFDIEKEVFQEIQTPLISHEQEDYNFSSNIQVLRGCLCLFGSNKSGNVDCFDVWMMMDYGVKESWTKLFTIVRKEVHSSLIYRLFRFCENGEIIIRTSNTLFAYNPINNKARRVEFGKIGQHLYQNEIFIESLVSLNSGVYMG